MQSIQRLTRLKNQLHAVARHKEFEFVHRPEWDGDTFQQISDDMGRVFLVTTDLLDLPVEHLSEQATEGIRGILAQVEQNLVKIKEFQGVGHAGARLENIASDFRGAVERLDNSAVANIPYLAHRQGRLSLSEILDAGNSDLAETRKIREDTAEIFTGAERLLDRKMKEFDGLVSSARDVLHDAQKLAANSVLTKFTAQFDDEATRLDKHAIVWLRVTGALAVLTILCAVLFNYWPEVTTSADQWETIRTVANKGAIIAVLFTGTIWCGRIYRALVHQATTNRHRSMSLKTFETFASASTDDRTTDLILMAAARTIFGRAPTGLVTDTTDGREPEFNFVEIGRPHAETVADATTK